MPILKDQIQILRVFEQSNSSQIVVALGRRLGQFRVMAKGVRRWPKKGFEGGFDLLARGEILAYPRPGEQLWIFKEWDERARPELGQSYRILAAGSYLCELTEALTRMTSGNSERDESDDSNERLFDLLEVCADALAERAADPGMLLLNFTLNALACEGMLPALDQCLNCDAHFFENPKRAKARPLQAETRAWLSCEGLECAVCFQARHSGVQAASSVDFGRAERGIWLSPEAHRALLYIQKTLKALTLSPAASAQLSAVLPLLVHGALERDLRTLPYAMSLLKRPGN